MNKKRLFILLTFVSIILLLSACSGDEASPEDRLKSYIAHWKKNEFNEMYKMDSENSTKQFPKEKMADRYEKLYKELGIKNLKVTYKAPDEDALKKEMKKDQATFPIKVKMDSAAGPISFDTKVSLKRQEDKNKKTNWYVNWNPGLIFPQLKDGGSVMIQNLEAQRGEILDRNQMPLAINDTAYRIGIVPEQFGEDTGKMQQLASLLGMSVSQIKDALSQSWVKPNLFVPLKVLTKDSDAITKLMEMPGVSSEETKSRTYPAGPAASHLIGYIGHITAEELKEKGDAYKATDMIGKRGLEQVYEEKLRGHNGTKITVKDNQDEETVLAETPAKNGENIKLTIDSVVQEKIYKSYNGDAGTSAAINPKTGETLAIVSSPGFDPNEFVNGVSSSRLEALQDDPEKPLINRFNLTYAPGSVIKPISAMIGLKNGTIKPHEGITINGLGWSNGKGWGNYEVRRVSSTDKPVDVTDALVRSDNIFFAKKGVAMGAEKYEQGLKDFGFAEKIPYAYPIKQSQISNSGKFDSEVLLANSIYGQGEIQMSSLHIALAYAPMLNNGIMPKPVLLASDEKGKPWHEHLIKEDDAKLLQKALRKVVTDGTAMKAKDAKVQISGKTGTAELKKSKDSKGHENSWFVAFPSKDKDIVISMMVEKAEGRGHIVVERVASIISDLKK